jgi:hypothetical protein
MSIREYAGKKFSELPLWLKVVRILFWPVDWAMWILIVPPVMLLKKWAERPLPRDWTDEVLEREQTAEEQRRIMYEKAGCPYPRLTPQSATLEELLEWKRNSELTHAGRIAKLQAMIEQGKHLGVPVDAFEKALAILVADPNKGVPPGVLHHIKQRRAS